MKSLPSWMLAMLCSARKCIEFDGVKREARAMDVLAESRLKHLSFDDYQTYAYALTSRIKKERKKQNLQLANLLLVEKHVALCMLSTDRSVKLKKLRKAVLVGSKLDLSKIEALYLQCVKGLYLTYTKDLEQAYTHLYTAKQAIESISFQALGEQIMAFFEPWKQTINNSLKQVQYQMQLSNMQPKQIKVTELELPSAQNILAFGARSFYCSLRETFKLYELSGDASVAAMPDHPQHSQTSQQQELLRLVNKSLDKLTQNAFEQQYLAMVKYMLEIDIDLHRHYAIDQFEGGKSLYRCIKRIDFVHEDCAGLLTKNDLAKDWLAAVKQSLDKWYADVCNGNYSETSLSLDKLPRMDGIFKMRAVSPNSTAIKPKAVHVALTHVGQWSAGAQQAYW